MLDAEELAAIRGAIGHALSAAAKNVRSEDQEAAPVALISDDQAGERARPDALRIAGRWMPLAKTRLLRGLGIRLDMVASGAELISGSSLREELTHAWMRMIEVRGREGACLLAVSGPVIDVIAGRLLGGSTDEAIVDRQPSVASLSVFSRAGDILLSSLGDAWREEQAVHITGTPATPEADALRRELLESESLLVVSITISGPVSGRIRLLTHPKTIVAPPPPARTNSTAPELIERALGDVPVELRVELGNTRMTMAQISELRLGALITLQQSVDSELPVRCAGLIKAFGRPTIWKGALAVEIASPEGKSNT